MEDIIEESPTADHPELVVEKLTRFNMIDEMMASHRAGTMKDPHYKLVNSRRWTFDHDDGCTGWFDFRGQMRVQTVRFRLGDEPGSIYMATLLDDMSNGDDGSLYEDHVTEVKALRKHLVMAYVAIVATARPEVADFLKLRPLQASAESPAGSMDGTKGFAQFPPGVHRTPRTKPATQYCTERHGRARVTTRGQVNNWNHMSSQNKSAASPGQDPFPMSAAMSKIQHGLDEFEALASQLGKLPIEARVTATERLMRTMRVAAGGLNESTEAVNRALFGDAYRHAQQTQNRLASQGQAVLEQLVGRNDRQGDIRPQRGHGPAHR